MEGEASVYGTGTGAAGNQDVSGWGRWGGPHGRHITILHGQGSMVLGRPIQHDMRVWAVLDMLALSRG
jgi:hypothetical protein